MRGLRAVAVIAALVTAGLVAASGGSGALEDPGQQWQKWQPWMPTTTTTTRPPTTVATTTPTTASPATTVAPRTLRTTPTTSSPATLLSRGSPQAGPALNPTTTTTGRAGAVAKPSADGSSGSCPSASLSAAPTTGPAPLHVHFDGSGSSCYNSWTLTFGDNTPNDGPNEGDVPADIPHTYSNPGTYTATLQVCQSLSDAGIGSVSAKQYETCDSASVTIDVLGPNVRLTPLFSTGVAPLTVSFTGQDLNAPSECAIGSWTLTFGDGSSTSGSGPPVAATHIYPAHGNYIPHLTMTDCLGTGSGFALVKVDPAPPTAVLDVLGGSGLQVTFSGANSHDPDDAIASWSIDFGDGAIMGSNGAPGVVSHTFPGPGTYKVTLTVTDTTNLSDSTSVDVTVPFPVQAAVIPPVTPPVSPPVIPPLITPPPFVPPVLPGPPAFTPPIVLPQPVVPSPVISPPPFTPPLLVPPPPVTPSPAPPVVIALALRLDQPSVAPGGEVTARGQGCPGSVPVTLLLGDKVVGTTTSNPDGRFQAPVSTNDIPVGDYQLVAHCGDRTVTTQLSVVLAQATPPSSSSLLVVFLFMLAALALLRRQLFPG